MFYLQVSCILVVWVKKNLYECYGPLRKQYTDLEGRRSFKRSKAKKY